MRNILLCFILVALTVQTTVAQSKYQHKIDSLLKLLQTEKTDTSIAALHTRLARYYFDEGKPEPAMNSIREATAHLAGSTYRKKELSKAYNSGSNYYLSQSDYLTAEQLADSCLRLRKNIGDEKGSINTLNSIGIIHWSKGDYPGALNYYMDALKAAQQLKDSALILRTFNNIGIVYFSLNKFDLSVQYYEQVLTYLDSTKDAVLYSSTLDNIALVYNNTKAFTKALDFHLRALKIREQIRDEINISTSYLNLANVYVSLKNKNEAANYFNKAIALKKKINDKSGLIYALTDLSNMQMAENNYVAAKTNLLQAYTMSEEIAALDHLKAVSEKLALCFEKLGDYKSAYTYHKLHLTFKDSIFNTGNNELMMEMESKYQNEKKEIENKLLKNENRLQAVESEKKDADIKRQRHILLLVSIGLVIILVMAVFIYKSYRQSQKAKALIEQQKTEVENKNHIIEEKQKEILDSINYAKRIQYTLLANEAFLATHLPSHFTYFNPKDIVSGDFYWAAKQQQRFYLAVCDSTGHGVPGAFMSLLNIGFLSEAINEKNIVQPNEVFDYVRMKLIGAISGEGQKDGFDGILVCFDTENHSITYAAANNAPVLVSDGLLHELPADRMPVGLGERKENFSLHRIEAKPGDVLYLYTDGYADQFGGPKGKKFKYKQLNELLLALHSLPVEQQAQELKHRFESWRGDLEQVDDVCIIGVCL